MQQIDAWRNVTNAVHLIGGRIFAQLNHSGRTAHSLHKNGQIPVAPSAIAIKNQEAFTSEGQKDYEIPRALSNSEVMGIIQDYKTATINVVLMV